MNGFNRKLTNDSEPDNEIKIPPYSCMPSIFTEQVWEMPEMTDVLLKSLSSGLSGKGSLDHSAEENQKQFHFILEGTVRS